MADPRDVDELLRWTTAGRTVEFLFFWGHRPERDGSPGRGCLSQWWPAPFDLDGHTFATAEHYMMWRKATLFGDAVTAGRIVRAPDPRTAKQLGREVRGFDERRWARYRYEVVLAGTIAKFGRHADLAAYLRSTGDRLLVEASPTDRVWGIGLAADDPRARDPARWRGPNLLGFALTEARAALSA